MYSFTPSTVDDNSAKNCNLTVLFLCDVLQEWAYDEEHELILAGLLCLDMSEIRSSDPPRLMKCHGSGGSQQWTLGVRNHTITLLYLYTRFVYASIV